MHYIYYITFFDSDYIHSGVYRISFRGGGGVKIFSGKVGVFAWREAHAARSKASRLLGGLGGMLPQENFKKLCNLVRFREYFAKILLKIVLFYMKIIDNVLLRTIFRGIGAYSPDFLSLVRFGVFWSTVSVNFS